MGKDKQAPEIYVIMSVYNGELYVKEAIESILNQTFSIFEFLIIEDASKDKCLKIIQSYEKKDKRITLFMNEENKGLTKNFNFLLKQSKWEFVARMDCDDISEPEGLQIQLQSIKKKKIDILGTQAININEKGDYISDRNVPTTHQEIDKMLPKLNPLIHPTILFKRSSLLKRKGYDEKYRTSQDYALWFKAVANGLKIENLDLKLLRNRINENYLKRKTLKYHLNDYKIKKEGFKLLQLPFYMYFFLIIPLILSITPQFLYKYLKKMDPR